MSKPTTDKPRRKNGLWSYKGISIMKIWYCGERNGSWQPKMPTGFFKTFEEQKYCYFRTLLEVKNFLDNQLKNEQAYA